MKIKFIAVGGGLAAAIGTVTYVFITAKNKKLVSQNVPDPPSNTPMSNLNTIAPPISNGDFPLSLGSRGPLVQQLQAAIGLPQSEQDGKFGPKTLAALRAVTGLNQVLSQTAFNNIVSKAQNASTDQARLIDATNLFNAALSQKSANNGNYTLMPKENITAYRSYKILKGFMNTNTRLTSNNFDYIQDVPAPNLRIVAVNSQGYMYFYDYGIKKYFYTNPYYWQLSNG